MAYETLNVDHLGPGGEIARITLNRPAKRNALTPRMIAEIHAALDELESGPCRAVILTGAGKSFCAGMDLSVLQETARKLSARTELGDAALVELAEDSRRIAALFARVHAFSKPLIAAVNGHALAGGCGLATLCDITLAAPDAQFGYTEVRIGFMPAFVSIYLIRQIGEKRARDLLLSGRIVHAAEARDLGLVNEIVPAESLLLRAQEIAARFASVSPTSVTYTKRLLAEFFADELLRATDHAVEASARIRATADFREGLAAFLEKREPRWQGV